MKRHEYIGICIYAVALLVAILNVDSENIRQTMVVLVTMLASYMAGRVVGG